MRLKLIERGNGLTETTILRWEKSSTTQTSRILKEIEHALEEVLQEAASYEWLDQLYDLAREVLEEAGDFPTKCGFYKQVGDQWELRPEDPNPTIANVAAILACFTYYHEDDPSSYKDLRQITAERFGGILTRTSALALFSR